MMQNSYKTIFVDVFYLGLVSFLSLFLISFYFNADYLGTGYPDWLVHAYRIKMIDNFGLTSWTHVWSNGISLWKSYQFIPHFITLAIARLAQVDIARAMVLVTIGNYVLLRIFMYSVFRFLKFTPTAAFVCAVLSFDIGQYWGGVGDYSLMFAFTFFPFVFLIWTRYVNGHLQYFFPYLAGVLFYVHPMLGFSSLGLWICTILFSGKKIISTSTLIQFMTFLAASSLFWYPIVFKSSYAFSSPEYANKYFLNLALSRYDYYGLSLFLLLCLAAALFQTFMPHPAKHKWIKILMLFVLGYFSLIIIGINFDLPRFISQIQFTRGTTIVGLSILFAFAPVVERIQKIRSAALKGSLLFILALAFIEGMWFTSIYSAQPAKAAQEPVSEYIKTKQLDLSHNRVWSSDIDLVSYFPPLSVKLPYSYMNHLDSNPLPQRIAGLLIYHPYLSEVPQSYVDRVEDYFKITGTKYVFFEETSPFVSAFLKSKKDEYKDLGVVNLKNSLYHVFEYTGLLKNAALIDKKYQSSLNHFPYDLQFTSVNDKIALDEYVHTFVSFIDKEENQPLAVEYPSQTSLQIGIPENRKTNLVYVDESFDPDWKAYFNNKLQKITSAGPNFMVITLDNTQSGGTLILQHYWPISFYISVFLIGLIPLELILIHLIRRSGIFEQKEQLMNQL